MYVEHDQLALCGNPSLSKLKRIKRGVNRIQESGWCNEIPMAYSSTANGGCEAALTQSKYSRMWEIPPKRVSKRACTLKLLSFDVLNRLKF